MPDPQTTNILLSIPTRGSDVGTWDLPVNGDFAALDGFFGGVQTVSASNVPITLTAPAGTATPSGGPTQSQNAVLRFTGTLTSSVQVTLPLPGFAIIENLTTGNFVLSFRALASGQVIGIDQGVCQHIYNDGTNVRFVNFGETGKMEFWAGFASIPPWVSACTVPPYLLCDGGVYTYATYPYLGARFGGAFGGNGVTTFGVPDLRGRVPLAYDGTGTRITAAGCGINGQTIGASLDQQTHVLTAAEIPSISSNVSVSGALSGATSSFNVPSGTTTTGGGGFGASAAPNTLSIGVTVSGTLTGGASSSNTGGLGHNNVQPSQVAGVWVIKAA